jgi:hypothetical protein
MGRAIRRHTVYVVTVLSMVALAAGFVLAASIGGITPTVTHQNAGQVTTAPGNTVYSGSPTINLVQSTGSNCNPATSSPVLYSGTPLVANVYVSGTAACTTNANDWFEVINWSTVSLVGGSTTTDTFFVSTTGGTLPYSESFVVSYTNGGGTVTGTLNLYLDAGPSSGGALPIAYTDISISVNGT